MHSNNFHRPQTRPVICFLFSLQQTVAICQSRLPVAQIFSLNNVNIFFWCTSVVLLRHALAKRRERRNYVFLPCVGSSRRLKVTGLLFTLVLENKEEPCRVKVLFPIRHKTPSTKIHSGLHQFGFWCRV